MGEPRFFVVESGQVTVSNGDQVIRDLGPAGWFGQLALLRASPRTATVVATAPVVLWAVEREPFLASVGQEPQSHRVVDERARDHDC